MKSKLIRTAIVALLPASAPLAALAKDGVKLLSDRQPQERPTLLVLGTAHFGNPGQDRINTPVEDVLSERRQHEIAVLVDQLAAFEPTHIAVEWPLSNQAELDARYADFRQSKYELRRGEIDQIGLRLAQSLDHERVFAVDWNDYPPGDFDKDYDWSKYGESHGQELILAALNDPTRRHSLVLAEQTVGVWLRQLNDPERLATSHRHYFDIASIGDADRQPGANWVGSWYARNLRIFANLVRLSDRPDDRILAIYGQGHAYLLRQFAVESGAFQVVDVARVLNEK